MKKQTGFTRIDVAVAVACIALVLAQAAVLNAGGRERSKREVCMANLRMLTAAWQTYADDNAGKIVNTTTPSEGAPQCDQCPDCPTGAPYIAKAKVPDATTCPGTPPNNCGHLNELPWVGGAFYYGMQLPECAVKCAIESGALYKYVKDLNVYRCPTGDKGELLTYIAMDSMNGQAAGWNGAGRGKVALKNMNSITKMSSQIVLIDRGRVTPDSFAVYYNYEEWWDLPMVRHEAGTCASFADGHSAYHKWKAAETISIANSGNYIGSPTTCAGKNDLYWVQIGCWGKLGYAPSCPVNP